MIRHDPRQFDLFAAPSPLPAAAPDGPRLTAEGITFEECDRRRETLNAAQVDRAAEIETLRHGAGAQKRDDRYWFSMPHGKPGLVIQLWQIEPGRWITGLSTSFGTGASLSGFYHGDKGHPTRQAALLALARGQVKGAARAAATASWDDQAKEAKQRRKAVEWLAAQLPPLETGVDLIAELDAMIPIYAERNALRLAASGRGESHYIAEDGRERSIYSL